MKAFLQGLKPAGISLAVVLFLDLIGFPKNLGQVGVWLMALATALLAFLNSRKERETGNRLEIIGKALLMGLVPALGLTLTTYLFATLQGRGINIAPVFAQVLPEHTGTLTGLTRQEVIGGANPVPGLVRLGLLLTAAGLIGGSINLIPRSRRVANLASPRIQRAISVSTLLMPFLFFGGYYFLRLPGIRILGPKENILGLILLSLFFSTALFSIRVVTAKRNKLLLAFLIAIITIWTPLLNDAFQNAVLGIVAIFVVMGIGLNIVVGFAGMLDLGYVAFFAVGAYSYAMLSSPTSWVTLNVPGFESINFWAGLPVAIFLGTLAGILLGIPVLRLRGDYLAIVTLGFGEIIRLILLNLRDYTGGPGGVLSVPPPYILNHSLGNPRDILFLAMAVAGLVAFLATRLKDSRVGRAWIAMREDEQVAQAMGINLVATKLLAFGFGALFAAISGTIYASRQVNIFPDNFALDVSINVLSLIIIGGIGSIEGVVIGAIALIGLPEILRGVDEYRIVAFGALLVSMMIVRPEGLLPSQRRMRELHQVED